MQNALDPKKIEDILRYAVDALQESKNQMFEIVEAAQAEYNRIMAKIAELKQEIIRTIEQVDQLEREYRKIRMRLSEASRDFSQYGEEVRRLIYQQADQLRIALASAKEREKNLQQQRLEKEQALSHLSSLVDKAEKSVSRVGVALDFLTGNLVDINSQLEGMQMRYQLGPRIIKMQEDERKRVAREIHDGPAQDLANVVLKAEICAQLLDAGRNEDLRAELSDLKSAVKDSLHEIRKIIHNLRPMVLDDLGLVPAVKRLIEEVTAQTGIEIHLDIIGKETRLDSVVEVAVFRIIQEALNNSRKYANASMIKVKLEFLPEVINAAIEDNGIGFDVTELKQTLTTGEHFGIYGMRERVELLDGTFTLYSRRGGGTRIGVKIPLQRKEG